MNEDTYRGQIDNPQTMNLYTYCSNNPIIYTDPTGHWGYNVHYKSTKEWATDEFSAYIDEESLKLSGVKKKNKKGKTYMDYTDRNTWHDEQMKKVPDYVDALAAGDQYVDQENVIFKRVNFAGDGIFHGLNGLQYTGASDDKNNPYNFIDERKSTAATILTGDTYDKTEAINEYIVTRTLTILGNNTSATKASKTAIKGDLEDKIVEKIVGKKQLKKQLMFLKMPLPTI